jgi:hypothetical protein
MDIRRHDAPIQAHHFLNSKIALHYFCCVPRSCVTSQNFSASSDALNGHWDGSGLAGQEWAKLGSEPGLRHWVQHRDPQPAGQTCTQIASQQGNYCLLQGSATHEGKILASCSVSHSIILKYQGRYTTEQQHLG